MNILIIRPGAIGDSLLTFPVIQALRRQYSEPYIALVSNAAVLSLALESGLVEEVSAYSSLRWSELFSTGGIHNPATQEQLQRTDLAICWLRDPDGIVEKNLCLAGVKRVIVAAGRPPAGEDMHIVDYLAETVGIKRILVSDELLTKPAIHLTPKSQKSGFSKRTRVGVHPGSGGDEKCWPVSCFASVIERLWQHDYTVLLPGGPADDERINNLQNLLLSPPGPDMLHLLIDAPLTVVAEHLQECRCYLGNDSGITHLAAMLGIPTVALFGPSDPVTWRPIGPSVEVIQDGALKQLPVNMVMDRILQSI